MIAPSFWQAYFIGGELFSLYVLSRRGFAMRYKMFAAANLQRISRNARIITGCVAVAICTAIWPPLALPTIIRFVLGFIAGAIYQMRRRK
jgi:hypothetical protein